MNFALSFDPLLPPAFMIGLGVLAIALVVFAVINRLAGWPWRAICLGLVLMVLAQPLVRVENHTALDDIVLVIVDETASQKITTRPAQSQRALAHIRQEVEKTGRARLEIRRVADDKAGQGTLLIEALQNALGELPRGQIAGVFVISDGQIHDRKKWPALNAPLHFLQTGQAAEWDLLIELRNAPSYAIIDEPIAFELEIHAHGPVPEEFAKSVALDVTIDGAQTRRVRLPVGVKIEVPLTLAHAGQNVIEFRLVPVQGELTTRNNAALLHINGIRDRMRVLLVSGEPHPGTRTWRNLLKSDPSVDLVHFTILRPPHKQDGVPVNELALIAFPTYELFMEKIKDFDLIIFDRYQRRGILPSSYLENVARYVREGGAVLVSAGPDFASAQSLFLSPLSKILPAKPDAQVFERPFTPSLTDLGQRHPITAGLEEEQSRWGPWLRQVGLEQTGGAVILQGADKAPLLVVNRVEKGRVALIASDQSWLWARGYEGGGPQDSLLRRLSHWLMKEPELEEEKIWVEPKADALVVKRRSLQSDVSEIEITLPDGRIEMLRLDQKQPGTFEGELRNVQSGMMRFKSGDLTYLYGAQTPLALEFQKPLANAALFDAPVAQHGGGVALIENPLPRLRFVREGQSASGRGWLGLWQREAFEVTDSREKPLLPAWLGLLLAAAIITFAWFREGRLRG